MSKLKYGTELFLGKIELDRMKKFFDDDGFRMNLLDNSSLFGLIKNKIDNTFNNGFIYETAELTIGHKEIRAINSAGNLIYKPETTLISVPADNQYYWVKIEHLFSPKEKGTFSIDVNGNLVCTSLDGELLSILRGMPDYPTRIKFYNSVNNILEYDVIEIIDNNNAIVEGDFIAETDLQISVIGTFTPGTIQTVDEKEIFQYDSCTLSLVQSTNRPTGYDGLVFYLARVKNDGLALTIEDRRTDIWETRADYTLRNLTRTINPLFGIEKITFSNSQTPRDRNIVYVNWNYRTTNWTFNPQLNLFTINIGEGGRFKNNDVSLFNDGDFDGWRLYTASGNYYKITSSLKQVSQIKLYLDTAPNPDDFTDSSQQILVCPDAEEIEISFTADTDDNTPNANESFIFPINAAFGQCSVVVYKSSSALYNIVFRYKHLRDYTDYFIPQDDAIGYYNENQFNANGVLIVTPIRTPYVVDISTNQGWLTLIQSPNAYTNTIASVITGDLFGYKILEFGDFVTQPTSNVLNLVTGTDFINQHIVNRSTTFTLTADLFINLNQYIDPPTNTITPKAGNKFIVHLEQGVNLNGFKIRFVTNYVNPSTFTLIHELTNADILIMNNLMSNVPSGYRIDFIFNGGSTWVAYPNEQITRAAMYVMENWNDFTTALGLRGAPDLTTTPDTWTTFSNPIVQAGGVSFGVGVYPTAGVSLFSRYKRIGKNVYYDFCIQIDNSTGHPNAGAQTWYEVNLPYPAAKQKFLGAGIVFVNAHVSGAVLTNYEVYNAMINSVAQRLEFRTAGWSNGVVIIGGSIIYETTTSAF